MGLLFLQQLPGVAAWGVDLPLVFTVLVGLRTTVPKAAGWGFLMGLVQDLLAAGWIGPNVIAKTLVGILSSFSQRHIYRERVLTQTFLIFGAVFFHQLVVWLILEWDGTAPPFGDAFGILFRFHADDIPGGDGSLFFCGPVPPAPDGSRDGLRDARLFFRD